MNKLLFCSRWLQQFLRNFFLIAISCIFQLFSHSPINAKPSSQALATSHHLRLRLPVQPGSYDAHSENLTASDYAILQQCHEGLVRWNAKGEVVPGLAESWSHQNYRKWTFKLRSNVRWSNGEKITAQQVLNSWYEGLGDIELLPIKNLARAQTGTSAWSCLGVKARGNSSIEIELDYPVAEEIVLRALTHLSFAVLHGNNQSASTQAILRTPFSFPTSGAFYLVRAEENACVLQKNPYYYEADKIYFDVVTYAWPSVCDVVTDAWPSFCDVTSPNAGQEFLEDAWDLGYVETLQYRLHQEQKTSSSYHGYTEIITRKRTYEVDAVSNKKIAFWEEKFKPYCHIAPYNRVEVLQMKPGGALHTNLLLRKALYQACTESQSCDYGSQAYSCPLDSLLMLFENDPHAGKALKSASDKPEAPEIGKSKIKPHPLNITCGMGFCDETGLRTWHPASTAWSMLLGENGRSCRVHPCPARTIDSSIFDASPDLQAELLWLGNLPSVDAYFSWRFSEPKLDTPEREALLLRSRNPTLSQAQRAALYKQMEAQLMSQSTLWPWVAFAPCYLAKSSLKGIHFHHPSRFPMVQDLYFESTAPAEKA